MKVVECRNCGGWVSADAETCQTCGHAMRATTPQPTSRPYTPVYETKMQRDPRTPKKILFSVICLIAVAVLIFFAFGGFGAGHQNEIKFQIYASGECTYTFTYLDGNGIHQSTKTVNGNYWVSVKGAQNANLIVFSDVSVTAEAYVNGKLVDRQSGTYVMVSAVP